jgi:hypothetical protein
VNDNVRSAPLRERFWRPIMALPAPLNFVVGLAVIVVLVMLVVVVMLALHQLWSS